MKAKNLEDALQTLRDRGLTVTEDVSVVVNKFSPDAEAYDAYNRLVAIVLDETKVYIDKRRDALMQYAADNDGVALVLIEVPSSFMKSDNRAKRFTVRDNPPAVSGIVPRYLTE